MPGGDASEAADLAVEAEQAGWDGFFCYEPTWGDDAWVMLTAAAMRTRTIRLGTMLTPLPKRKPWEVASQAVTLDDLSGGRVILSVGLGAPEPRFYMFEDDPGRTVRAEMLDEGLELLALMCRGEPFEYEGKHYHAHRPTRMVPPPSHQQPRVPTWVVGLWPAPVSMRRSARWDGWLPNYRTPEGDRGEPSTTLLAEGGGLADRGAGAARADHGRLRRGGRGQHRSGSGRRRGGAHLGRGRRHVVVGGELDT